MSWRGMTDSALKTPSHSQRLSQVQSGMNAETTGQSQQDPPNAVPQKTSLRTRASGMFWWVLRLLTSPLRGYLSLRRSMTTASVIALLASILALNVIWGFPWSGMMGGCLAVLLVGWAVNRMMRPKLDMSLSVPRSAVCGEPFSVGVHLANRRVFPALDLQIGWNQNEGRNLFGGSSGRNWDSSGSCSVPVIRSGGELRWNGSMRFTRRGIHPLPAFQISSTFPFFFFRHRNSIDPKTQIAITPAPLNADDDPAARMLTNEIGDWAGQLMAGAPVEYVGNREYEVGMPVRRWDFASWARLGRPIVREYHSPSIQSVTLLIDASVTPTSISDDRRTKGRRKREQDRLFERLMSVAATVLLDVSGRKVQLHLFVSSEDQADSETALHSVQSDGKESMLMRLAAAQLTDPTLSLERMKAVIDQNLGCPMLLLSTHSLDSPERENFRASLPPSVKYIYVRVPNETSTDLRTI